MSFYHQYQIGTHQTSIESRLPLLTSSQKYLMRPITPELPTHPYHLFPQLLDTPLSPFTNSSRPPHAPLDWSTGYCPARPFETLFNPTGPRPPPPPRYPAPPKQQVPTAFYLEQLECARPPEGPDPFLLPEPETTRPWFQVKVQRAWKSILGVVEMIAKIFLPSTIVSLHIAKILLIWLVLDPASFAGGVFRRVKGRVKDIRRDEIVACLIALLLLSWIPVPWDEVVKEEAVVDKPLYILMTPLSGDMGTGRVTQT